MTVSLYLTSPRNKNVYQKQTNPFFHYWKPGSDQHRCWQEVNGETVSKEKAASLEEEVAEGVPSLGTVPL